MVTIYIHELNRTFYYSLLSDLKPNYGQFDNQEYVCFRENPETSERTAKFIAETIGVKARDLTFVLASQLQDSPSLLERWKSYIYGKVYAVQFTKIDPFSTTDRSYKERTEAMEMVFQSHVTSFLQKEMSDGFAKRTPVV